MRVAASRQLFAVREIQDKEPVGFFWARDLLQLAKMLDTLLDPGECEYKAITKPTAVLFTDGGLMRQPVGWQMGVKAAWDDGDEECVERCRRLVAVSDGVRFDGPMGDQCGNISEFVNGSTDITGWTPLSNDDLVKPVWLGQVVAAIRDKLVLREQPKPEEQDPRE